MPRFGPRSAAVVATWLFLAATARTRPGPDAGARPAEVIGIGPLFHIVTDIDRSVALLSRPAGLAPAAAAPRTFAADPELQQLYNLPGGRESATVVRIPGSPLSLEFVEWRDVERSPVQPRVQDPGATILMLTVRDLDEAADLARRARRAPRRPGAGPVAIDDERGKRRVVLLKDPDGFFIELTQPDTLPEATASNGIIGATFAVTIDDTDKTMRFYREAFGFQPDVGESFVPDQRHGRTAWFGLRKRRSAAAPRSCPARRSGWSFSSSSAIDRNGFARELKKDQLATRSCRTISSG